MSNDFNPKLRHLEFVAVQHEGDDFLLTHDRQGLAQDILIPRAWGAVLSLFDGERDAAAIIFEFSQQYDEVLPREYLDRIVAELDEAFILDSPSFQAYRNVLIRDFVDAPVRPATLAGLSYPSDPDQLRALLQDFYNHAAKITPLSPRPADAKVRGIVVPHIDFTRGGPTEALAYGQMWHEEFDTFLILGIAHSGVAYPFCAAEKDFETPLGTCVCDHDFLHELNERSGGRMLNEQYAHKNEHSVEFVTVFLQTRAVWREAKIVPIICGGFFHELRTGHLPMTNPRIAQFVEALRETVEAHEARGKRIGLIASVDLSHVGSRFDDDTPLTPERLDEIKTRDLQFLECIEKGDAAAMHAALACDNNVRNVDAHPAVYTLMAAFPEMRAQLLDYQQAYDKEANSVVSFAAMTLY